MTKGLYVDESLLTGDPSPIEKVTSRSLLINVLMVALTNRIPLQLMKECPYHAICCFLVQRSRQGKGWDWLYTLDRTPSLES
jgi:hypothetical protein